MENTNAKYTIEQVLEMSRDMLGNLRIPVSMNDIATEIDHVRSNISACIETLQREKAKHEKEITDNGNKDQT